jgi:TPP-dependent 2-oxoacid decarboxylase
LKIATLNVFKIFVICVLLLTPRGSNNELHNDDSLIKVGQVTNEIRMGKFAGNRNLTIGVRNILEELLLDLDYDLSDQATTQINVRLVFFDVKDIGTNIGIYHKDVALTQIIAIGELEKNGKVKKRTTQKGVSKTISTSTLVVADDGTFNQQTASIALKKLCENIIKDLL